MTCERLASFIGFMALLGLSAVISISLSLWGR